MTFLKKHSFFAIAYFLFIALLGVLLRLFPLVDTSANYKYLVHTHSHIALLGWVYTALTTLIYKLYLSNSYIERKYRVLFWYTQITIIGMLLTFPVTGYALFSIIFSTLFLIASYLFIWFFIKHTPTEQKKTNSYKCIRIALWYMVLSSLGPWALGVIMNTVGSGSDLYRNAIYFYLHFQYNGWFIIALFGVVLYFLEQHAIFISKKTFRRFFWLINSGVIATFGISLLWMKPHILVYVISIFGALLQLFALGILVQQILPYRKEIKDKNSKLFSLSLKIVTLFFFIKLILQLLGSIPFFANIVSSNVDVVIGYLHWIFLGVVSTTLLLFLYYFKLIKLSKKSMQIYVIGFILTESLIFYKGVVVWLNISLIDNYFWYLVIVSSILLIAIINIFSIQFKKID